MRRRSKPPDSELLVDLCRLAQRGEIVLALLEDRIVRQPVADFLLHLYEGLRRQLAPVLDEQEMPAAVLPAGADEIRDLPRLQREGGAIERGLELAALEVAHVATLLGGRTLGEIARHLGESLAGAHPAQRLLRLGFLRLE